MAVPLKVASWWYEGLRVGLKRGFASEVTVNARPTGVFLLPERGSYPFELRGKRAELRIVGPPNSIRLLELYVEGVRIPPSEEKTVSRTAPEGSRCANDTDAAALSCLRCGTFCCRACSAADGMHCKPCFARADLVRLFVADTNSDDFPKAAAGLVIYLGLILTGVVGVLTRHFAGIAIAMVPLVLTVIGLITANGILVRHLRGNVSRERIDQALWLYYGFPFVGLALMLLAVAL